MPRTTGSPLQMAKAGPRILAPGAVYAATPQAQSLKDPPASLTATSAVGNVIGSVEEIKYGTN